MLVIKIYVFFLIDFCNKWLKIVEVEMWVIFFMFLGFLSFGFVYLVVLLVFFCDFREEMDFDLLVVFDNGDFGCVVGLNGGVVLLDGIMLCMLFLYFFVVLICVLFFV